jgi:hypothetical protein
MHIVNKFPFQESFASLLELKSKRDAIIIFKEIRALNGNACGEFVGKIPILATSFPIVGFRSDYLQNGNTKQRKNI